MFDTVIVHYSEIGTKGKNRPFFENVLLKNIKRKLRDIEGMKIKKISGRIIIKIKEPNEKKIRKIKRRLEKTFGVAWFSFGFETQQKINQISKLIVEKLKKMKKKKKKFKVFVTRADKSFPLNSMETASKIGSVLVKKLDLKVDLENPKLKIFVELVDGKSYVYFKKYNGLRGLPVGVTGKVCHLLSGGIDSPVAAWFLMKRGCKLIYVHFHPFMSYDALMKSKIMKIIKILNEYGPSKVYFIPFDLINRELLKNVHAKYRIVVFRRIMMRIAEKIAEIEKANGIGTGESLGQVASQTLENIKAIEDVTSLPILRPLIGFDKDEIVKIAKKLGTYELSIIPYQDCCSLLIAKHPETKAKVEYLRKIEKKINMKKLVNNSIENSYVFSSY